MHKMAHAFDPAEDIRKRLGKLPRICGALILAATYVRPNQTQSGLHLPDKVLDEDVWQGKAHLVVAMGPEAYRNDEHRHFVQPYCAVGDWIIFTPNSGRMVKWNGVPCRLVNDVDVQAIIDAPDIAY
jgi:co-chaperonin GroES (HSP10)